MTAVFPDLTPARGQVEALMADTCAVTRDPQGARDDEIDPVTLALTPPVDDTTTVYQGKCLVVPLAAGGEHDGAPLEPVRRYRALIPLSAPTVRLGDKVSVTKSARDPQLVGRFFAITDVAVSTFAVVRDVVVEELRT